MDGVKKQEIVELAQTYRLQNVIFLPYQPREQMPRVLASADTCLVILKAEKSKTTIQSKTYEILAMGKPIIASVDKDGDNWQLIENAQAGLWTKPSDPNDLARKIRELYKDCALVETMGNNGKQYVEANNTIKIVGQRYQSILAQQVQKTK
ncbi:MAG: glycosyltransferase [Chloroflexota bacterium]